MSVLVVILTGQSNAAGVNPGEAGGAYPAVRYLLKEVTGSPGSPTFGDLVGTNGSHRTLGRLLHEAGHKVALGVLYKGSTFSNQWIPGQAVFIGMQTHLATMLSLLPAEFPGERLFRFVHLRDQGEAEARYEILATVQAWAANTQTLHDEIEEQVFAWADAGGFVVPRRIPKIANLINETIDGATFPGVLRAQQLAYADITVNRDESTGVAYEGDGVHPTTAGYITVGERDAAAIEETQAMGTLSADYRTKGVDHFRNKTAITPAATHYFAAYVAGVRVNDGGKGVKSVTNNTTLYATPAGRSVATAIDVIWADPDTNWGSVDEIRLFDGDPAGAGVEIGRHVLDVPVPIGPTLGPGGDPTGPLKIPAAAFEIAAPPGCLVDAQVHGLLGLICGATAFAPVATVHGTYFAGDPQGAGVETSAVRTSITQATAWEAATSGSARTAAPIALADEADATHYAEYSASSGGSLRFSAALPAVPSGGAIPAGGLRTRFT